MNADEKRKVFEELLEGYQDVISSEFSYEDGEREAERKAWLNKYDGIKEPLIKDKKIRKAVRAWADTYEIVAVRHIVLSFDKTKHSVFETGYGIYYSAITLEAELDLVDGDTYTIAELCGEEEE